MSNLRHTITMNLNNEIKTAAGDSIISSFNHWSSTFKAGLLMCKFISSPATCNGDQNDLQLSYTLCIKLEKGNKFEIRTI